MPNIDLIDFGGDGVSQRCRLCGRGEQKGHRKGANGLKSRNHRGFRQQGESIATLPPQQPVEQ
jgi:hypothetical protein